MRSSTLNRHLQGHSRIDRAAREIEPIEEATGPPNGVDERSEEERKGVETIEYIWEEILSERERNTGL